MPLNVCSQSPIHFQANWPKQLDPHFQSFWEKIRAFSSYFPPFFLYSKMDAWIRHHVFKLIVPGNFFLLEKEKFLQGQFLLKKFFGYPLQLHSPDGAKLDGAFFPGKNKKKAIIYALPNAMEWENAKDFLSILKPLQTSIALVNPRCVGKSTGRRYENGYALDIYSVYDFLIKEQGLDPENILLIGYSMGGAYGTCGAALVQKEYQSKAIKAINIRSFSDLQLEIQTLLSSKGKIKRILRIAAKCLGFHMNVKAAWDQLRGEKCLFFHPLDQTIPFHASLYKAVSEKPVGNTNVVIMQEKGNPLNAHMRSLFWDEKNTLQNQIIHMLQLHSFSWPSFFTRKLQQIKEFYPLNKLQTQVEKLYQRISGKKEKISIHLCPSINYAGVLPKKKELHIHPLTTLHLSDLPKELQVEGISDKKLQDPNYFPRLKKWLAEKFHIKEEQFVDLKHFFDLHLRLWSTKEIKKIQEFVFAHEMAHIFQQHPIKKWDRKATFLVTSFPLFLLPYHPVVALGMSFLLYLISKRIFLFFRLLSNQKQETQADFIAYQVTRNSLAPKYFLEAIEENRKKEWERFSFYQKLSRLICSPEKVFYPSHPSPKQRIQTLELLAK